MLETILAISGKPGLYRLINRGNRSLIVETLDAQKKRMPAFGADKIISLADIAMYTDEEEVPLRQVLKNIYDMEGGKPTTINYRKASNEELADFMAKALPNYDRDRVYMSHVRKLIQWYNILVEAAMTDFVPEEAETEE
jgi:hypothetical protein